MLQARLQAHTKIRSSSRTEKKLTYEPKEGLLSRTKLDKDYRWKVGAKLSTAPGLRLKLQRALAVPNCLGLGNDARWRWQWIPLSILMGIKIDPFQQSQCVLDDPSCSTEYINGSAWPPPYVRIKSLTPILGKLALRPVLELLPDPALIVRREFPIGSTKLSVQANIKVDRSFKAMKVAKWIFQVDWHPADSAMVQTKSLEDSLSVRYSRGFNITQDRKAAVSAVVEFPRSLSVGSISRFLGRVPVRLKVESVKLSQKFGNRATRDSPLPPSAYLKASSNIGNSDIITVVPGHWIDPGFEPGAPGERDFNLEVANVLEKQLRGNGWEVLRPDRDAPYLSWEEYLNWVSKQTLKGIPVMEIHGQGSTADYRGFVLGVIGDTEAPLSKELAADFGYFNMDWRELGVPRRGGVIVESFNADEVLRMAPWHRTWAVRRLANRIVRCVERASFHNRAARGVSIDPEPEHDLVKLDTVTLSIR